VTALDVKYVKVSGSACNTNTLEVYKARVSLSVRVERREKGNFQAQAPIAFLGKVINNIFAFR
jgi:hypothetical protein